MRTGGAGGGMKPAPLHTIVRVKYSRLMPAAEKNVPAVCYCDPKLGFIDILQCDLSDPRVNHDRHTLNCLTQFHHQQSFLNYISAIFKINTNTVQQTVCSPPQQSTQNARHLQLTRVFLPLNAANVVFRDSRLINKRKVNYVLLKYKATILSGWR